MRTAVAAGIALALVLLVVVGNSVTQEARASEVVVDTSNTLGITATGSFSFTPNIVSDLPLSTNLTVTFTNGDPALDHTFTILGCEGRAIPVGTADIAPWVNGSKCGAPKFNVQGPPGMHTKSFTTPASAGWYMFICTEAGHFFKNMYGYIAFGMAVPANLSVLSPSTGPGTAVFIIVGTIVALTVIAIVLGFVVGRREGSRHEMPPERLGYAEPSAPTLPKPPAAPPAG